MKIRNLTNIPLAVPVESPLKGHWTIDKIYLLVVQLTTDKGLDAFGLVVTFNERQIAALKTSVDELSDVIIGQDIDCSEQNWYKMYQTIGWMGSQGYSWFALSAIDSALWCLRAKSLDLPLAKLLGGFRDEVPVYASHLLSRDCGLDELQKDAAKLVDVGFQAMKMKMGGRSAKEEVDRFRAVREAVGDDVDIMIDVNWAWTVPQAIQIGRRLESYHPYWLEDPVPTHNIDGLSQIAVALDIPVIAGENLNIYGFDRLLEKRAVDMMMIDIQFVGGITQWIKAAVLAESRHLPVVSHVCHDFAVHLIAAVPNGLLVEYMPWWDVIYQEPLQVKNGSIKILDKPGLGLELSQQALKKYRLT
jgi:L-alanine-DL-glutamate epimerase-like enolase superfamily enzyme